MSRPTDGVLKGTVLGHLRHADNDLKDKVEAAAIKAMATPGAPAQHRVARHPSS